MKSIFDPAISEELIQRINAVTPHHSAQWGKMNVSQMLNHCMLCDKMFLGEIKINRVFMGRLFGKMVKNSILKGDKQFGKNAPTSPVLSTAASTEDMEQQKKAWIDKIRQYQQFNNLNFVHPFFGPMTKEEVGIFAYKHADHHLRQFGA